MVRREGECCYDPVDLPIRYQKTRQGKTNDQCRGSYRIRFLSNVCFNRRYHQKKWRLDMVGQAGHAIGNEEKNGFGLIPAVSDLLPLRFRMQKGTRYLRLAV